MRLALELSHEELNQLQTPVVVERWDKKSGGRAKRAWLAEFTEAERQKALYYYRMFYSWYLIKGTPQSHFFKPGQLQFIERLVNFFGTI